MRLNEGSLVAVLHAPEEETGAVFIACSFNFIKGVPLLYIFLVTLIVNLQNTLL